MDIYTAGYASECNRAIVVQQKYTQRGSEADRCLFFIMYARANIVDTASFQMRDLVQCLPHMVVQTYAGASPVNANIAA